MRDACTIVLSYVTFHQETMTAKKIASGRPFLSGFFFWPFNQSLFFFVILEKSLGTEFFDGKKKRFPSLIGFGKKKN